MVEMFDGYEFFVCPEYRDIVPVSNLLVIADGSDPHVVFDDQTHVHHKNEVRWDNRLENLEVRDRGDHLRDHFEKNGLTPGSDRPDWWDKDALHSMYWKDGMTQQEIADTVGVSQKSVSEAFEKLDIETRSPGQSGQKPWHDRETLNKLYIEEDMSQREVAEELGVSEPTIRKWLDKTGVWPPE